MTVIDSRRVAIEEELGLGTLLSLTQLSRLLAISTTKLLAIMANKTLQFPKPVYTEKKPNLYALAEVEQWRQRHDAKTLKIDWDVYRVRKRQPCIVPMGEGKLYQDTHRFYRIMDSVLNKRTG